MSSEMIERMALAMQEAAEGPAGDFDVRPHEAYVRTARAAIEAMREPTSKMLLRANRLPASDTLHFGDLAKIWQVMVDEAGKMMRITIRNRRVLRWLGFDAQGNTTELTVCLTLRDWGSVIWRRTLRDWWRGWSDEDLNSAVDKIEKASGRPGSIIPLTNRELRAHMWLESGET